MFRAVLLSFFMISTAHAQSDFDINDCIINGLKGVASDAAAEMVKVACERKQQERPEWKTEQYRKQLGTVASVDILEIVELSTNAEIGFHSLFVKNVDPERTITFLRIKATPAPIAGKECDYLQSKFETFRVTIPPGSSTKLLYPNRGGQESCVVLVTVFSRDVATTDKPSQIPVKALARDPLLIERK